LQFIAEHLGNRSGLGLFDRLNRLISAECAIWPEIPPPWHAVEDGKIGFLGALRYLLTHETPDSDGRLAAPIWRSSRPCAWPMSDSDVGILESASSTVGSPFSGHEDKWQGIDRHSGVPLFLQLAKGLREILTQKVREGALKPGDFFTTEKAVCQQFGVSTITAKRVLDDLEAEGLLTRRRGRGTYVAQRRITQVLDHFYRFTTEMRAQGMQPTWHDLHIGVMIPDLKVAEALRIRPRDKVTRFERLRSLNDEPFLLSNSYLPQSLFPGLERKDHKSMALYDLLAKEYNLQPTRCRETYEPVLLEGRAARLLKVPAGSAGMMWEHLAYSAEGTPLEYSRGVIRGDRCRLTVDLH
jgi:GntR family transcriptional regulator